MEGLGKYGQLSTENRQFIPILSLGTVSFVAVMLLLHFTSLTNSYALRDRSPEVIKRSASPSIDTDLATDGGYTDYQNGMKSEEYPIVIPKRAALIFDRILKGLQSASENNPFVNDWSPVARRGNSKDKLYFRCYFNAVSCYKKK